MFTNNKGFTLIEIMVSLVIFMFGVMSVLTMQATAIKGTSEAELTKKAIKEAGSYAEQLKLQGYNSEALKISEDDNEPVQTGKFKIVTAIEDKTDSKLINLQIQWDFRGKSRTHNLEFAVFNPSEI